MLYDLLVSAAIAQEAGAAAMPAPSPIGSLLPLIFVFVIFYFLLIRPQQKKMKQHQEMLKSIVRGDKVVTGGGIHGKVTKVEEGGLVKVEIAEGIEITVDQSTISNVPGKVMPATKDGKKPKAANDNK